MVLRSKLPYIFIVTTTCAVLLSASCVIERGRAESWEPAAAVPAEAAAATRIEPAAMRRERPPSQRPVAVWRWPAKSPEVREMCSLRNPDGSCAGELSTRKVVAAHGPFGARAVLEITRAWQRPQEKTTCTVERQTPSAELRVMHDVGSVTIYGRTESGLYTWQFNLNCELTATGELPASVLNVAPSDFAPLPLVARLRASLEGVYFATEPPCEPDCELRVSEPTADHSSLHPMVAPIGVTHGYSDDHIWWAYWNTTAWHVRVIDRQTHQLLLSKTGQHGEAMLNPIAGLAIAHRWISVRIGSFLMMGRLPSHETAVYDIASGQLVASFVEDMP